MIVALFESSLILWHFFGPLYDCNISWGLPMIDTSCDLNVCDTLCDLYDCDTSSSLSMIVTFPVASL